MAADLYDDPANSLSNPKAAAATSGNSLYKAATLLVILLFLLSFWSC